ncbi:MAG: hypothetical protein R2789_14910 [Microthrixaceae bacterium]
MRPGTDLVATEDGVGVTSGQTDAGGLEDRHILIAHDGLDEWGVSLVEGLHIRFVHGLSERTL